MSKYPLKLRELLKVLKSYGIVVKEKGGKGSEIAYQVIDRILAGFDINPEQFWK